MLTAEEIIEEIYLLPIVEREKIARHFMNYGIIASPKEITGALDLEDWRNEIDQRPIDLKKASEYLGVSPVTLRRWIKSGRILAYKTGRAFSFDLKELKRFKLSNLVKKS
ncbi:MAG: helix-turn-helix domain-containing protein [Desulfobacterales bacterium]|nr:helix-turn-helix domain-containing protein [Desulfobacterales bacterium]